LYREINVPRETIEKEENLSDIKKNYDVIVVGGGHAGIEATAISAKRGFSVLLLTLKINEIGEMSCNPAIGGLAKGHLVKEIDALGGVMGVAIDNNAIQYRLLNTRKGSAVRSSRAQADKRKYSFWMRDYLLNDENITIKENNVSELILENSTVLGVRCTDGSEYFALKTILTTGTFLNGLMHTGSKKIIGGRSGSEDRVTLSDSLLKSGIELGRLKTGTPARLDSRTINYDILEVQHGDKTIKPFSFKNSEISYDQIPCYITHTNTQTHDIIRINLHRSPLFSGIIQGTGPRYCPSIEDKVVRFPDRERHQVFLEPEGTNTISVYPNGISTSLPEDVQNSFIKSIKGLEDVSILKYGYAVEYDFVYPTQLKHSLGVKNIENLFLAGQINGTSGYEEAAAQGLIAGINAINEIIGRSPINISRYDSYTAVLIDDLVLKGTLEPYRMFTSRAEHRLLLREDNADIRLKPLAIENELLDREDIKSFDIKKTTIFFIEEFLKKSMLYPSYETNSFLSVSGFKRITRPASLYEYLKISDPEFEDFIEILIFMNLKRTWDSNTHNLTINQIKDFFEYVKVDCQLEGYINRENRRIKIIKKNENIPFPPDIDIDSIPGIKNEIREKLKKFKPENLYEAGRISGLTPAAIDILHINIVKHNRCKTL